MTETPAEIRARILAETLARLEVERLAPPPRPHPTTEEIRARHAAGLDDYGFPRQSTAPLPDPAVELQHQHQQRHLRAV